VKKKEKENEALRKKKSIVSFIKLQKYQSWVFDEKN